MTADTKLQVVLDAKDISGQALNKFETKIEGLTNSLFSFRGAIGALGALTGGGALGALINRSIDLGDSIAKTSAKLGLSGELLQEYRYAAERSGVSTENFDKSMEQFTNRVGEAAQGQGELVKVLERYNIALTGANGQTRGSQEIFRDLADVIQGMQSPTERMQVLFDAFGRSGGDIANMLKDGSAGLDAYAAKARNLGIVLGDDLLAGSERARDAIDDLQVQLERTFTKQVVANADNIARAIEGISSAITRTTSGFSKLGAIMNRYPALFFGVLQRKDFGRGHGASGSWEEAYYPPGIGGASTYDVPPSLRSKESKTGTKSRTETPRPPGIFGVPIGSEYGPNFADRFEESFASIDDIMADFKERQQKQLDDLLDAESAGYGDGFVDMFAESFREVETIVEQSSKAMIELTERTADAMQQNFGNLFFDFMQGEFKSLEDYGNAVLESLNRAVADFLSQQLVEGLFGSLTKAGGGGGWIGQLFGAIAGSGASAKGNVFGPGGIKQFYRGGMVTDPTFFAYAGGLGIMGERGAEAILPLERNRRGELGVRTVGAAGAGSSPIININVSAPRGRIEAESMNQLQTKLHLSLLRAARRNA